MNERVPNRQPTEDEKASGNGSLSAFVVPDIYTPEHGLRFGESGLSKRELFAAMAMQAILTGAVTRGCPSNEWVDQDMSVRCADALLKELAK